MVAGHTSATGSQRFDPISLVEDDTAASLGLLRTVANLFETLNRQISFLKQTNIP